MRAMSMILEASLAAGGRALVIEPEDETRRSLMLMLRGWRLDVRSYSAAAPALADGHAYDAAVLLVAQSLPDSDADTVLRSLRQQGWQGRAILVADTRTNGFVAEARNAGFSAVLSKPISRLDVLEALVK